MAKTPVKKAVPVRKKAVAKKAVAKKAVAKKAAPVAKKAVAKKAVEKKAAPVRKKVVAKKAVAKKAVAKKAAPVRKKAVAKKATAKKAAPVRKKAVAKKAASSRVKKIDLIPAVSTPSTEKTWLQREPELPVFLKDVKTESKKEPISTQGYTKKKSRKPVVLGFASVVILIGVSIFSASNDSGTTTKPTSQTTTEESAEEILVEDSVVEDTTPTPSPSPSKSELVEKSPKATLESFAPRNFASSSEGQEISFTWIAPAKSSSVIGYELSTKKAGSNSWVVISSMTPQQLLVSVDLVSMDSTSQYKIASILENGKLAFSKAVLSHPGTVD